MTVRCWPFRPIPEAVSELDLRQVPAPKLPFGLSLEERVKSTQSGPSIIYFIEYGMRRRITLVKIFVVAIVLVILVWIVASDLGIEDLDDPIAAAKSHIRVLETNLTLYRMDNSRYPTTEQGLAALVQRPDDPNIKNWKDGGYLHEVPRDPWGNEYLYANPGQYGQIDIYTLGRDGHAGGEGLDDTIGNWNLKD